PEARAEGSPAHFSQVAVIVEVAPPSRRLALGYASPEREEVGRMPVPHRGPGQWSPGSRAVIGARAAPSAELAGHHTVGDKLAVGLLAHRENAVTRFEVLESDGLAVLHENGLVIDHDRLVALARISDLDLISVDRGALP